MLSFIYCDGLLNWSYIIHSLYELYKENKWKLIHLWKNMKINRHVYQ